MPWDFKFTPAMADLIQTKIIELLPTIEYGIEELNIISYYSKDIISNSYEPSLVEMYKEYIVVYPNCPNKLRIDTDGPTEILMKDMDNRSELNITFISITSQMQEYNYISDEIHASDYTWEYTKYDKDYFMYPHSDDNQNTNRENRTYFPLKELNQKDTLYRIVTTISFGYTEEDDSVHIDRYNRCIEITTLMDSKYITDKHGTMRIRFYYEGKPSNDYCICKLRSLGSDRCPFQNYLDNFSIKHILDNIMESAYSFKEKISNGEYIELMNNLKLLNEKID